MINIAQNAPLYHFTGIGYKSVYLDNVMANNRDIGWLEIHAENYMIEGGPRKRIMCELAERYPISCHGVGLSIGTEKGLDKEHLQRLKALMAWLQPAVFSEHLAWSSHDVGYLNDLLPLPYTKAVLTRVADHICQVQDYLGRQMLLENPSTYVTFTENEMSEIAFITEIVARTGCGLLLDVNNVYVSANNQQYDAKDYVDHYPMAHVKEIHLGGHDQDSDEDGNPLLIDSHNNPVVDPVWQLYAHTIAKAGVKPTLIEWDNDLPDWDTLKNEVHLAQSVLAKHHKQHHVA